MAARQSSPYPAGSLMIAQRLTGGRWTRPDLVSVAVRTYRYLPGKHMEVVTFEDAT
jgi:hypothetical protein